MPLFGTFRLESSATFRYQLNAPRLDWFHSPLRPEHRQLDGQARLFSLSGIWVPFRGMPAEIHGEDVLGVVPEVSLR